MRSTARVLLAAMFIGSTMSFPDPNIALDEFEFRDENGYISIRDLGELLSGMCGQLNVFKETLAGTLTAGIGTDILKTPLPLPNLAALDFLGIIKIVTQGLGMALEIATKGIGANPEHTTEASDDTAVTTEEAKKGFLLTVGDILDMAEYLCKVVNLVAAVLNNKLFDILHINRITIPLKDPRHPLPDLSWVDKLDILNLRGLVTGLGNVGAEIVHGFGCIFGCSEPTTTELPLDVPKITAPEKPSVFDNLDSYYNFDRKK